MPLSIILFNFNMKNDVEGQIKVLYKCVFQCIIGAILL
jgi:hypothetical protein